MLFLGVLLLFLVATDAFMFPKVCIPPGTTDFPVPCCPLYNGTPCGSGENRGSCMPVSASRSVPPPDVEIDDRYMFPGFYFSSICQCKGYFGGIDCGGCAENRYGDYCEKQRKLIREEIRQKNETEQKRHMITLNYCKKKIDPDYYILVTGDRSRSFTFKFKEASYLEVWAFGCYYAKKPFFNDTRESFLINFGEGSTGYLSWNRKSLLYLENRIQKCMKDPTFTLSYYDWTPDNCCAICNNSLVGGSDEQGNIDPHSALSHWRMICADYNYPGTYCLMSDNICERPKIRRQPGAAVGSYKPTRADVEYCLSRPHVDTAPYTSESVESFRNCLEVNIDASMSQFFGGTMSESQIASNDPLCILHKVFMDKVFEIYLVKWGLTKSSYPDNDIYGHGPYDCIMPFYQCTRNRDMFVTSDTLGYYYSTYKNF